jgi:hypothetical protein
MSNSIYSPKNIKEAMEMANVFSDCGRLNAQEILLMHATYGHHYGGNMGLTMTQAYSLKGKPTLNADAMAGIVRNSGLCKFIKIDSWNDRQCTLIMSRQDEDFEHTYTYTIEMAEMQGLTRNANWAKMPMQMLRARCLTMGLRATFPEAVSGIYSADEIADNMVMSDDERLEIVAESLGEEVKKNTNAPSSAPPVNQAPPINQEPTPQHIQKVVKAAPPEPNPAGRDLRSFEGWQAFVKWFNSNPDTVEAALEMKSLKPQSMTESQIYLHCIGPLSNRGFKFFEKSDIEHLRQEDAKPLVEDFESFYGPMALEVYEEDYKEALAAYIAVQSQPWRVELISTLKNLHIILDHNVFEDLKKNILACNNWLEYKSLSKYIKSKVK